MVKIFFSRLRIYPDEEQFRQLLSIIPESFCRNILAYKSKDDRTLRLMGKLLLIESFKHFGINKQDGVFSYELSKEGKPSVDVPFCFSLSYTKGIAVCIASDEGNVGIDIEFIESVTDIDLYKGYFSECEWQCILTDKDRSALFYQFWTKKEAVLKASGKGLMDDMSLIEVLQDEVIVNVVKYNVNRINILPAYICSVATNSVKVSIEVEEKFLY